MVIALPMHSPVQVEPNIATIRQELIICQILHRLLNKLESSNSSNNETIQPITTLPKLDFRVSVCYK
jgi:hypothetical protein